MKLTKKIIAIIFFNSLTCLLLANKKDSIYVNSSNPNYDRVLFYGVNRYVWIEHKAMTSTDSVITVHYGYFSKKGDTLMFYFSPDTITDGQKIGSNKNLEKIVPDYLLFSKKKGKIFHDVSGVYKKMFGKSMPNYAVFTVGLEFQALYTKRELFFKPNKGKYIPDL